MSKRTEANDQVERIKKLFSPFLNIPMNISFAKFSFPIVINDIKLSKLTGLENKPDPREYEGKKARPAVMQLETNSGILYFVIEDTIVTTLYDGIKLQTESIEIEMRKI